MIFTEAMESNSFSIFLAPLIFFCTTFLNQLYFCSHNFLLLVTHFFQRYLLQFGSKYTLPQHLVFGRFCAALLANRIMMQLCEQFLLLLQYSMVFIIIILFYYFYLLLINTKSAQYLFTSCVSGLLFLVTPTYPFSSPIRTISLF